MDKGFIVLEGIVSIIVTVIHLLELPQLITMTGEYFGWM